jgi:hypothetical protein
MKKLTPALICLLFITFFSAKAQQQVNNSGFESWENLGTGTEEPVEWNSFKTGSGSVVLYTSQQIVHSLVVRPGATGDTSCLLWSKSTLGIVANGEITTGQVNADNIIPANAGNYNITHTAQPAFSETLGNNPDSLVIWVRFKPSNATGSDSARIHATIHDTYDVRDPLDAGSLSHVVGEATLNFPNTNNTWIRESIPFVYSGPATSPDFILISITTNKTPGGGSAADSLYVDDMLLIYNGIGVPEINSSGNLSTYIEASNLIINLSFGKPTVSDVAIYNLEGQLVYKNQIKASSKREKINISNFDKGIYLVSVITERGQRFTQKIVVN